jgi:hypothetical protein
MSSQRPVIGRCREPFYPVHISTVSFSKIHSLSPFNKVWEIDFIQTEVSNFTRITLTWKTKKENTERILEQHLLFDNILPSTSWAVDLLTYTCQYVKHIFPMRDTCCVNTANIYLWNFMRLTSADSV